MHVVIYIYIYIYIYTHIHTHTHTNLPVNAIVRLPHPWSRDSQGQETFLAPSADKQTRKPTSKRLYNIYKCSNQLSYQAMISTRSQNYADKACKEHEIF